MTSLLLLGLNLNWTLIAALDFSVIWDFREVFLRGFAMSLGIAGVAIGFGLGLGTLLAILHQSGPTPLAWAITVYVEVLRNMPLLVQLIWIHFALPFVTGVTTTPVQSGLLAMSLQSAAYFVELVRAGIGAVPKGQSEAALAFALPARIRWGKVILPQAMRIIIPPMVGLMISIFKATAILSVLQISELMTVATRVSNHTFRPIEILTFVALVYFVVGYSLSRASLRLERRLLARVH